MRTKLPEVYASLKAELLEHLSGINAEYPAAARLGTQRNMMPGQQKGSKTLSVRNRSVNQFFKSRDRNSDGAITVEEFIGNPDGRNVSSLTKRFQRLDTNRDNMLVIEELENK